MAAAKAEERWSSRLGVILAVAGSAVGLGNFLRFPGLAAQYGSGAFMLAYFISLIILGIPICWAEWTLGRYGGERGFHSSPGVFHVLIRHPVGKYIGVIGVLAPVVICMYYIYIEAWVLAYSCYFLTGHLDRGSEVSAYIDFWQVFVGYKQDGLAFSSSNNQALFFLLIVFALNFFFIYRGLVKGIEFFCKYALPALVVLGVVVLIRVLTLGTPDPAKPEQNVINGLGSMWNPEIVVLQERKEAPGKAPAWTDRGVLLGPNSIQVKRAEIAGKPDLRLNTKSVWEQLRNPQLWLAAAGQIFFSLGVGFGIIITYASYLRSNDDVVLSALTATSANEFCEVGLGGLITVPAAFIFLGTAGVVGQGTFDLGFKVLPLVFAKLPLSWLFGWMFFFLLFLAAITSSLSMLQPGLAFLEEGLGIGRKQSVALLGLVTAVGSVFVVYYSKDLKALDTLDFWVGTVFLFMMATAIIIYFGWGMGIERAWREAHQGAVMQIPGVFKFVMKYLSPLYLIAIFVLFILFNVFGWQPSTGEFTPTSYVSDLIGPKASKVARLSACFIIVSIAFFGTLTFLAGKRWDKRGREGLAPSSPTIGAPRQKETS
jgi:neurotransmitter:Na+ symporter, NSS family